MCPITSLSSFGNIDVDFEGTLMDKSPGCGTWRDWCELIRLPNVFTVVADSAAAFLLVTHRLEPLENYAVILVSVCFLYWAGMILNDVWDLAVDSEERPSRPLPSKRIPVRIATAVDWAALTLGVLLAFVSGMLPRSYSGSPALSGGIAILLAAMIVLYDAPVKRTPLAPIAMGLCRFLSFLLAASAGSISAIPFPFFDHHVLAIAAGFGIYIVGVTTMARGEAVGGTRMPLMIGLVISIAGFGDDCWRTVSCAR